MVEQRVEDFIKKIETLRTAKEVLLGLKYARDYFDGKSTTTILGEVYLKIEIIHQKLLYTLKNSALFEKDNTETSDTISDSLGLVINILRNTNDSEIPETAELIEVLEFCLDIPNETEISEITKKLSSNKEHYLPQIRMLRNLCLILEV